MVVFRDDFMSSINYICTMITSHFRVTKNTMSAAKRPRTEDADNVTGNSGGSGGMLATRDANPPIMPVPGRIANQMSDYATYTLRYTELFSGVDITSNWTKQFRINSIFDPNYTDSGHQPMGRDLLATVYNYYRVLKTEFSCELARGAYFSDGNGPISGTVEPAIIGDLVGTGISTIPTSVATLGETKRGRCWLSPSQDSISKWDRTIYPGLLDETIDTNGATDQTLLSIWTPMGSNPAEEQYYTIMADTAGGYNSTATVLVQIKFTVQFRCPNVDVTAD